MTSTTAVTNETINSWADDPKGPVALYLKQRLLPVEGEGGVIFPPTYADIGYNIDTLSDGTKVAMIDSVGSQANRMEPIFKHAPYSELVPQIEIEIHTKDEDDGKKKYVEKRSILDLAHRSADAVVHSSPTLSADMAKAFTALKRHGDARPLCILAPTSLLFGVWDSRGGSGEKRPRLVRSVIRAWNVEPLYAAAQFNSIWKSLDEDQQKALEAEAKAKKTKLSEKGFADAPATFRKVSTAAAAKMTEYRDGSPNPERRVLGGVIANGRIERDITINLVALRAISGEKSEEIRRYLLSLALLAATADIELFLREGCHLRFADERDTWVKVPRRGSPEAIDLSSAKGHDTLLEYARAAAGPFSAKWPQGDKLIHKFDLKAAKQLLAKKGMDEPASE
ncbi:MAG: type I-U CRISPR-associated protein Cas7 [Betaproteobacteria bacterium]|nr:type I-U CRISPR-associated protein Cas7 [Betaproteobacteria bacterium]